MKRPNPKRVWQHLVDEAGEAEIERAASVSVQQAERELAAVGFDVAAERARASAFLDELAGLPADEQRISGEHVRASVAPVIPIRRKPRRPMAMWLATAASFAALGGQAALWYAQQGGTELLVAHPRPTPAELRRDAAAACDAHRWSECISLLDGARDEDPAGDTTPDVQGLRERANKGLADER